ncbi:MAG: glycosyltransferase family 87 protein [Pseudolabrys sp.]|nr:glycosyltransferase family 87 protein [Pseudolabrys sp.]
MRRPLPDLTIAVARCFIAIATAIYLFDLWQQTRVHWTNGALRPFGDDFINYWSGAYLFWHGRAAEIYDAAAFHVFQQGIAGAPIQNYHYSYPPVLLLLTAPLAIVPYVPGLALWLVSGWYAFYRALRLATPGKGALLLALATPAVFINAIGGQNGTWTAALFGFGLGLIEKRPLLAGGLLSLLIYKPQIGLLIPVALIAGRHWRAFITAVVTTAALVAVSLASSGVDIWADYLRNLSALRQIVLEDGTGVWHRFVSVFVAARRAGAPVDVAYAIQAFTGIVALIAVALVWWRQETPLGIKSAVLLTATCMATPYLQDYDLVFGALVVVWLWHAPVAASARALPIAVGLLLILPLVAASLGHLTGLALGPLFILPIFVIAVWMGLQRNVTSAPVMV